MGRQERSISSEQIAQRAYEIWESRGCPTGDGTDEWMAAERELLHDDRPGVIGILKKIVTARILRPVRKAG